MTMWGQPPSAVRASAARQAFLSSFPTLKFDENFSGLRSPLHPNSY
jgi:hypothetical protein